MTFLLFYVIIIIEEKRREEVLEECEEEELDEKEIYYIEKYHSYIEDGGYNLTRGGSGSRKFTQQERRERIDKIV